MFKEGEHACSDCLVSIFQPHIYPILLGESKSRVWSQDWSKCGRRLSFYRPPQLGSL